MQGAGRDPREVPWKGKLASGFGEPEAVPGDSATYNERTNNCCAQARGEGRADGATPTGRREGAGPVSVGGQKGRPPTSGQEGSSFCP